MSVHPRDISAAKLGVMLARTPYPDELCLLVSRAREAIGFFADHPPRALEYPWILANLPSDLHGLRLLDVGAGVNPLPFVLADRGAQVVTLDNHRLVRAGSNRREWNEWGFLDYATLDARIASLHCAYEQAEFDAPFDGLFSVSVIEHIHSGTRRAWIERFRRHIRSGGTLLLTVDLVPGTDALWNLSEGNVVEARGLHGSFATLLAELEDTAFVVESAAIERELPETCVDTGFVKAIRGR